MIDEAPFGPKTVKAIGKTFDQASVRIKRIFGNDPHAAEAASVRLAEAILSIATESGHREAGQDYSSRVMRDRN
jgi:hypothetical protein